MLLSRSLCLISLLWTSLVLISPMEQLKMDDHWRKYGWAIFFFSFRRRFFRVNDHCPVVWHLVCLLLEKTLVLSFWSECAGRSVPMTIKGIIHVLLSVRSLFSLNGLFYSSTWPTTAYAYDVSISDSNRAKEVTIKSSWTRGLALHPLGTFQTFDDVMSLTLFDLCFRDPFFSQQPLWFPY